MTRALFICSVYTLGIAVIATRVYTSTQEDQNECSAIVMDCSSLNLSEYSGHKNCTFTSKRIDLSDNVFHQFPKNLSSSVEIILTRNKLSVINVTEKQEVKVLRVNSNKIKQIILGNYFEELRYLQASHNLLYMTGNFIEGQCNLTALFLSHNGLSSLLAATNCKELDTLDASHNKISDLPYNVTYMKNLVRLYLSHNALVNMSDFPSQLQILDLSYNQLETVPDFQNFTELRSLILSNNKIKYVDQNADLTLIALTFVNLSVNELEIVDESFSWMMHAREIDLSNNFLVNVTQEILDQWSRLEALDLSNNNLSEVPILPQMWDLKWISLANNQIEMSSFEQANALLGWGSEKRLVNLGSILWRAECPQQQTLVRRIGTIAVSGSQCACAEVTRRLAVLRFCVENPFASEGRHWFFGDATRAEACDAQARERNNSDAGRAIERNFALVVVLLSLALLLAVVALLAAAWSLHVTFARREPLHIVAQFSKTRHNNTSPRGFDHVQYIRRARSVDCI